MFGGGQQPKQSTTGGFSFATPNTANPPAVGGGSTFGQQPTPSSTTFGQPQASGFSFGANAPAATPVGSSFGAPATTPFGASNNTTNTSAFGAKPPSLTIGNNTFGQNNNTFGQNQAASTTTGLFGQPQATSTTTGLFGQPQQQQQQSTGGSLFGQPQQQQQSTGGSLFGQPQQQQQQSTGGSLFGQPQQQQTGGSLFGQPQQQSTGGSLFGKPAGTTTGGLFGQQNQGQSLFGQSNNTGGGLFGGNQQQQQMQIQPAQPQAIDYIKNIAAFWDPKNPACHFKHYFYNMVHPSEVHLYRPSPGEDPSLYQQAQANNPEPSCMVPVLAIGFDGLKTRLDMQEEQLKIHREKIEEFKTRLQKVEQAHTVETVVRIQQYKTKQRQIAHKVLQLMKTVQVLRNKGYSLRAEEESLMARLSSMDRDLAKPSVFRGRINELHALVQQQKDANRLGYGGMQGDEGFVLADPEALKPVVQTLDWMSKGLSELTQVVKDDEKTLDNVERAFQEALSR